MFSEEKVSSITRRKCSPSGVVRETEQVEREDRCELSWPGWKVILKLSMTLVSYCTGSVLSSPLGRDEVAKGGGDDVGCTLYNVGESCLQVWRGPSLLIVSKLTIEKRSRRENIRIANTEIPKIINPEFV
jgi:hypothetical protein